VKTSAALMPIRVNNTVQTTGKSQPAGANGGGLILSYIFMFLAMDNADSPPIVKASKIEKI